jgi:16S rRNA (guanine527-N7)-methyltransferase
VERSPSGPARSVFHVERDSAPPSLSGLSTPALLEAGLLELQLSPDLAGPLTTLAELLAQWAARMNLTGHRTPAAIAHRLILDALALGEALPVRDPSALADLGSGAGFPGLPLAVRWPACAVTLVEARERRHHFQRAAVRTLGLVNVEPRRGRIEALAPQPHQIVVAQALAQADRAIDWMLPWVAPGGWIVLPRSAEAEPLPDAPGLEPGRTLPYQVPLGGPARLLWIARRPVDAPGGPVVRTGRSPH